MPGDEVVGPEPTNGPPVARVREEASDVPLRVLTPDQQAAARRAHELLSSLLRVPFQKGRPEHWNFRPWVDQRRGNGVVLFDGGRGSGKTTVLLSLVYLWSRRWWLPNVDDPRDMAGADTVDRALDAEHWMTALQAEHRFIPLDVIDLRVLPKDASLLMRLASAFRRVSDDLEARSQGRVELLSKREWSEFARSIAYGWDANVHDRRAQIDPEMYMIELEDSELRGSDVHIRFRAFIDALLIDFQKVLSRDYDRRFGRVPPAQDQSTDGHNRLLFIVPIDDADMDPPRAAELLEMLRVVWHPSVAFLLTGESDLFLNALRANISPKLSDRHRDAEDFVSRLAAEVYDRAIPAQHRCALPPLPLEQRLDQDLTRGLPELLVRSAASEPATQNIREALAQLPLPTGMPLSLPHLGEYLRQNRWSRAALPGRLRQLVDLRQTLRARTGAEPGVSALKALIDLWQRTIQTSDLAPADRAKVMGLVELNDEQLEIVGAAALTRTLTHRVLHRFEGALPGSEIVLSVPVEINFSYLDGDRPIVLSKEISAALILATDVAADGRGYFVGDSPATILADADLVHYEFELAPYGSASWRWPQPKLPAFLDYVLIYDAWIQAVAKISGAMNPENELILRDTELPMALLTSVLSVAKARPESKPDKKTIAGGPPVVDETKDAKQRLDELIKQVDTLPPSPARLRRGGFNRWFKAYAHTLSAHEAGLGSSGRHQLGLLTKKLYSLAVQIDPAQELRQFREQQFSTCVPAVKGDGKALQRALRRVESLSDQRGSLVALLGQVHIPRFKEDLWGTKSDDASLADYLLSNRRRLIERMSQDEREELEPILERFTGPTARPRGQVESLLLELWTAIAPNDAKRDLLNDQANVLIVDPSAHRASSARAGEPTSFSDEGSAYLNRLLLVQNELNAAQRLIYRLAWDALADMGDERNSSNVNAALTPATITWRIRGYVVSVFWPVPYFQSLFDMELCADRWNEFVRLVPGMPMDSHASRELLDRMAYAYISLVEQVATTRLETTNVELITPTQADWQALLSRVYASPSSPSSGMRASAWERFKRQLNLFSIGALGLSPEVARRIGDFAPHPSTFDVITHLERGNSASVLNSDVLGDLRTRFPEYPAY